MSVLILCVLMPRTNVLITLGLQDYVMYTPPQLLPIHSPIIHSENRGMQGGILLREFLEFAVFKPDFILFVKFCQSFVPPNYCPFNISRKDSFCLVLYFKQKYFVLIDQILSETICHVCSCVVFSNIYLEIKFMSKKWHFVIFV